MLIETLLAPDGRGKDIARRGTKSVVSGGSAKAFWFNENLWSDQVELSDADVVRVTWPPYAWQRRAINKQNPTRIFRGPWNRVKKFVHSRQIGIIQWSSAT